jgi:hypothetical protein
MNSPDPHRNPDGSFGNFGRWPDPPRRPLLRRRGPIAAVLSALVAVLGIVALPGLGLAHHIDITRTCSSVTVESFSDGTMSILAQTGGVFAVGQTAPPGNPGLLTKPALPDQAGSVTVTWTTDSSHETVSWGVAVDCLPVTTTTTAPSTTTTAPETTTTTAPETTTTTAPETTTTTAPETTTTTAPTTTTSEATTTTTAPSTTTTAPSTTTTAPSTTTTTAPSTTTTGNPCDHRTPEETLPPQCFPTTTAPTTTKPPSTTVAVCAEGLIPVTDVQGNVHCTPTLIPPASLTSQPAAAASATPSFTG